MQNLYRRGGIWWARLSVPPKLRNAAGRSEFTKSTRTHDLTIAKMVASAYLSVWRGELLTIESHAMSNIDVLKIVESAHEFTGDGYLTLTEAQVKSGIPAKRFLEAVAAGNASLYVRLAAVRGNRVHSEVLEPTHPELGRAAGLVIPQPNEMPSSAEPQVFSGYLPVTGSREIAAAILGEELCEVDIVSYDQPQGGGWLFIPNEASRILVSMLVISSSSVSQIRAGIAAQLEPRQVEQLQSIRMVSATKTSASRKYWGKQLYSQVVEAYCLQSEGLRATIESHVEIRQRKAGLLLFSDFMGDCNLEQIDGDMLRAFRDGPLRTLPAKSNHLPKEIRKETMSATVQALALDGRPWPLMTKDMQDQRMLWIRRMFTWLKEKEHLTDDPGAALRGETGLTKAEMMAARRTRSNPLDDDDEEEGRVPFESEELRLIFNQSCYRGGEQTIAHGNATFYPFEYWLPLLGLFAGCRIKEASQLYLRDIRKIGEHWFIDINETSPDKKLKNLQSTRQVALHPLLIELGLIDYREELVRAGFQRLFPELSCTLTPAGYAKESGRKMSQTLEQLGMPRNGMKVFHCFRHNFNNAMTRVSNEHLGIDDEKLRTAIRYRTFGHRLPADINMEVYLKATPDEKRRMVSGISFPEVSISKKFDVQEAIINVRMALNNKHGARKGREDYGPNTEFDLPAL